MGSLVLHELQWADWHKRLLNLVGILLIIIGVIIIIHKKNYKLKRQMANTKKALSDLGRLSTFAMVMSNDNASPTNTSASEIRG